MQGRVQHRRVQPEGGGVQFGGQAHLGVDVAAGAPGGAQALEGGTVVVARFREGVVAGLDVDLVGAGRRPLDEVEVGGVLVDVEQCRGVPRPRDTRVGVLRPGVHGQLPLPVRGRRFDGHPELYGFVGREHQGCLEGEFGEPSPARPGAHGHGEFEERGAGQQHGAVHGVIGEPRLRVEGEPPRVHQPVLLDEFDHGAQQRVPGRGQTESAGVRPRGFGCEPVAPALEGVGG
ncbi:hypothetical protein SGRIM128S_08434 [Streptomyces griseomycini]